MLIRLHSRRGLGLVNFFHLRNLGLGRQPTHSRNILIPSVV
jgi:hypothetical protein